MSLSANLHVGEGVARPAVHALDFLAAGAFVARLERRALVHVALVAEVTKLSNPVTD